MIDYILDKVIEVNKQYEEKFLLSGERFNIFQIMNMEKDEVNTHSAVIANLLNPKASHGKGNLFLKHFIDVVNNSISSKQSFIKESINLKFSDFGCIAEVEKNIRPLGRIDILVSNLKKEFIIIENKIEAKDQEEQLRRYYEFGNKKAHRFWLIYLTKFGDLAKDKTTGKDDEVFNKTISISYSKEILEWLEKCKKEVSQNHNVSSIINQYIVLVKRITYQSTNKEMSDQILNQILAKKGEGIKAARAIRDNYELLVKRLKIKFKNGVISKLSILKSNTFTVLFNDDVFEKLDCIVLQKKEHNLRIRLWLETWPKILIGVDNRGKLVNDKILYPNLENELNEVGISGKQVVGWGWIWLIEYDKLNQFLGTDGIEGMVKIADDEYDEIIDQISLDIQDVIKVLENTKAENYNKISQE